MKKKLKNYIQKLHNSSKRNYLNRMKNEKVFCMKEAKKYAYNYWDGNRKFGYGGYKYIPGRWQPIAKKMIRDFKLTNNSRVLDIGCGKGYLLYELKLLLPKIKIIGLDISNYAIKNAKKEIKSCIKVFDLRKKKLPFIKKNFDLVLSLGTLHNFRLSELIFALKEISRVSKNSYIMVESYKNDQELFNLQCWALTAEMFLDKNEWIKLFESCNFTGHYEFIYFK